jgi:hypothetical protein
MFLRIASTEAEQDALMLIHTLVGQYSGPQPYQLSKSCCYNRNGPHGSSLNHHASVIVDCLEKS